ncbi:MAG: Na/Pi cotransporter family protein [Acetatifactor sp.]|nr:Na/Pi cotransporter family protein [Acetatifactor sp.]
MNFFDLLTMIGGLSLFLYGMSMLGDGLAKASGGRLEKILGKLTSNPIKAVLVGAGVTAMIQSSSATTVMVVGFVNSGIMKLQQAVGIIMGANIGTTITAWILSTAGIDSEHFLIQMMNPTSFCPILAIIGSMILLFSHKDRRRNVATIMLGFAILMFGMNTMSNAVKPLAEMPEFINILPTFSNPILGMLVGLIMCAVLQSSSVSVGILQSLSLTGVIGFDTVIPMILGQNIGSCVPAMLSSIGARKNAKRAALVHLYFNIIGTAIIMVAFYGLNAVRPLAIMNQTATPLGIAVVHTLFKVVITICLLPLSKVLVKLASLTVKDDPEETTPEDRALGLLDARFLETPSYAVEQSRAVAVVMAGLAEESMNVAMSLLDSYTEEGAQRVKRLEEKVDLFEDQLGTYLVKLSSRTVSGKDSHTLSTLLHCISDMERISDHALNVMECAREMHDKELEFSDKAKKELQVFRRAVHDILNITMLSFRDENLELAKQVEPLEEIIDGLNLDIKQRHVKRLRKGKCSIELGFVLTDIITNFERVSDHCSNIAVCLLQVSEDEFDTHAYIDGLKAGDNVDFRGKVMAYGERYQLP